MQSRRERAVLPLSDARASSCGGKARGLHLLLAAGARVPAGVVVADPHAPRVEAELRELLEESFDLERTAFAVRSSAMQEDGADASFAGQYQTILDVHGVDAVLSAVRSCVEAASSHRVRAYAAHRAAGADSRLAVIVQQMVKPRCAGVAFTADPVSGRRDRVLLSAVRGLGEELVGGRSSGELHTMSRRGQEIAFSTEYSERLLSPADAQALREESLRIEAACGFPADLEWAIDHDGGRHWLQLRPITTLPDCHPNELDCAPARVEEHLLTRCNVGEMMPGPVTPLSWSVFGRGIDVGLQDFMVHLRVQDRIQEENRFIFMFYNHLFIDMTPLYEIPDKVALTTRRDIDQAIAGRTLDEGQPSRRGSLPLRVRNFFHYVGYFASASRRLRALEDLARTFSIPRSNDWREMYHVIDARVPRVFEAWAHHYATSGKSGTLNTALLRILDSDGRGTTREHLGTLTELLTGLGGINGAVAIGELEGIRDLVLMDKALARSFLGGTDEECLRFLDSPASGGAGRRFREFLEHHGHRTVREAELRERDWQADPLSLVRLLRKGVLARPGASTSTPASTSAPAPASTPTADDAAASEPVRRDAALPLNRYSPKTRFIVRRVLPSVRRFVVARENSKSLCIRIQSHFKKAYLHLGRLLAAEGLLNDADEVFFLTHQELGRLTRETGPWARERAGSRRELYPSLFSLQFDDVFRGVPEPIEHGCEPTAEAANRGPAAPGALQGIPVSAGIVTARARVIDSLADAEELAPGEIMIASYTDVGWTPYFSTISGLVTEIGSTLSHGAVVAREYGIPAVVSVRGVKKHVRTGDTLTIDGKRGTVEVHARRTA